MAIDTVSSLRRGTEGPLRTTSVNVYELIKGAKLSKKQEANERQVRQLIAELEVYELDSEAAEVEASIFKHLSDDGTMVNELGVLIAGIVIKNGEKLVSRDEGFRGMPQLKLDSW